MRRDIKHIIKKDNLADILVKSVQFVKENWSMVQRIGIITLAVIVAAVLVINHRQKVKLDVAQTLGQADGIFRMKSYYEAATLYETAISKSSGHTKAYACCGLGNCRYYLKEYDAAVEAYRKCLQLNPDGLLPVVARAGIAASYEDAGNSAEATTAYKEIAEKCPSPWSDMAKDKLEKMK